MAKILIAYASMSGNTEDIADIIHKTLTSLQHEVTLEEIDLIDASDMQSYDAILLGAYTWGAGELPYETEDFYEEIPDIDLTNKKVGAFGSGDTDYPLFCEAVPIFEKAMVKSGAELAVEGLKVEFSPQSEKEIQRCKDFATAFSAKLG